MPPVDVLEKRKRVEKQEAVVQSGLKTGGLYVEPSPIKSRTISLNPYQPPTEGSYYAAANITDPHPKLKRQIVVPNMES